MSELTFAVTRVEPSPCSAPDCTATARNEVRMFFPADVGPIRVCGHHKHWAKKECHLIYGERLAEARISRGDFG